MVVKSSEPDPVEKAIHECLGVITRSTSRVELSTSILLNTKILPKIWGFLNTSCYMLQVAEFLVPIPDQIHGFGKGQ